MRTSSVILQVLRASAVILLFCLSPLEDVDARVKPGHDGNGQSRDAPFGTFRPCLRIRSSTTSVSS